MSKKQTYDERDLITKVQLQRSIEHTCFSVASVEIRVLDLQNTQFPEYASIDLGVDVLVLNGPSTSALASVEMQKFVHSHLY